MLSSARTGVFWTVLWAVGVCAPSAVVSQEPNASEETKKNAEELIEALESSLAASQPPALFELVGRLVSSKEFAGELSDTQTSEFRVQWDAGNSRCKWALRRKQQTVGKERPSGSINYIAWDIDGRTLLKYDHVTQERVKKVADSFESAVVEARVPELAYFGLLPFQMPIHGLHVMKETHGVIMDPRTTVTMKFQGDSLNCIAHRVESEKRFQVYRWRLSLPDYLPSSLTIDKAINGSAKRVWTQTNFWDDVEDNHRLCRIATESVTARRKSSGGFEIGEFTNDAEFAWLPLESGKIESKGFESLQEIDRFITEGMELAKE